MIDVTTCSVCGGSLQEAIRFSQYPLVTSASATSARVPLLPIIVGHCRHCSHVQLMRRPTSEQLDEIYLGDYTSVVKKGTFAGADRMAVECKKFFDFSAVDHLSPGATIMEIGCFDGGFLGLFAGFNLLGCEPNPGGREAAEAAGIRVIPEYFSPAHFSPHSIDLIVMRHLIEHVPDPGALLESCKGLLTGRGMLLIETPNIEHTLSNHVIGNFYHQHLHYFSIRSLPCLMHRAGYNVVAHGIKDFRQFMVVQPATNQAGDERGIYAGSMEEGLRGYLGHIQNLRRCIRDWFEQQPEPVAIYGASSTATGIVYLGEVPPEKVAFVIDADPRKAGFVIPGTNMQVFPPQRLLDGKVNSVIVASDFYAAEIEEFIRANYASVVRRIIRCHPEWRVTEL